MVANAGVEREVETRRLVGRWHVHHAPDVVAYGELVIEGDRGILSLTGGLTDHDDNAEPCLIFGMCDDGTKVTLVGAWRQNSRVSHPSDGLEAHSEVWNALSAYSGAWLPNGAKTRFTRAALSTRRLNEWAGVRPRADLGRTDGEIVIRVPAPSGRSVDVADLGQVDLYWAQGTSHGEFEASVRVTPRLTVAFARPLDAEDVWAEFTVPSVHWLILATGGRDELLELKLWPEVVDGEAEPRRHPALDPVVDSLLHSWKKSPEGVAPIARRNQVVPLDHDVLTLERSLPTWYEIHRKHRVALIRFFAQTTDPAQFADESFERIVRSLEVWSGTEDSEGAMSEADYRALLARLEAAHPSEWTFLKSRLQFANAKTLKQRLDSLLKEAGEPMVEVSQRWKAFVRRTVQTRNSLIHQGEVGDKFSYIEMFKAERVWELVLFAILLRRLGADSETVAEMLARTNQWEFLGHRLVHDEDL
jgi:hypothetical protein